MNFETILYKKEEGRGVVFFNRPEKLNALNQKVFEELTARDLPSFFPPKIKRKEWLRSWRSAKPISGADKVFL
jgi:hypothetical protein